MKNRTLTLLALAAILLVAGCAPRPGDAFMGWVKAIQTGNAAQIAKLDRDLAPRLVGMPKDQVEQFTTDLTAQLALPAATAFLETGLGVEPSAYYRKLYFPKGTKVGVKKQELSGADGAELLVEVNYPREVAPVYVLDVQVIWHGPSGTTLPGTVQAERPVPAFSSGYFEAGHPFLANPGYQGYELTLDSGVVQTATLKIAMVKDPKLGWLVADLTPDVMKNIYFK